MESQTKNSGYDARFSSVLGGEEYDDLLIALEFYNQFQSEAGEALKQYIQNHCINFETINVLEAGPGTGITTINILNSDPRVRVVSVDNEPKMLEAVKHKFSQLSEYKDRVEFVMADILAYLDATPDESFDAFVSVYTLHNFTPDFREKVLELIAKKLKHGGIFINGDKYAESEPMHKKDLENELKSYDKFDLAADEAEKSGDKNRAEHLRKVRKEWIAHMWEDERNRITVEEQNAIFEKLGFANVEWKKRYDLVVTVQALRR